MQPHEGTRAVIFSTEDGPAMLDIQLYMHVGRKHRSANSSVLERNGLVDGALDVFRSRDPARNSERTFVRPEDGAFNPSNPNKFLFDTTGSAEGVKELGRLYSLRLHPDNPLKPATLTIVHNADLVVAGSGDTAISRAGNT